MRVFVVGLAMVWVSLGGLGICGELRCLRLFMYLECLRGCFGPTPRVIPGTDASRYQFLLAHTRAWNEPPNCPIH